MGRVSVTNGQIGVELAIGELGKCWETLGHPRINTYSENRTRRLKRGKSCEEGELQREESTNKKYTSLEGT